MGIPHLQIRKPTEQVQRLLRVLRSCGSLQTSKFYGSWRIKKTDGRESSLPLGGEGAEQSEADEVETSSYTPTPFYPSGLNLIRPAGHLPLPGEGLGVSLSGYTFNY